MKEGQSTGEEARGGEERRKKVWGCAHRCGEVKMKGYERWWREVGASEEAKGGEGGGEWRRGRRRWRRREVTRGEKR